MGIAADIAAYKAQIDTDITTVTDPLSITPDTVGTGFDDLADIVLLYYGQNFAILSGTGVPSDAIGSDTWLYFRNNSPMEVYQKISGTWVLGASVDWGVVFADGPLIGLLSAIAGDIVTITSGQWAISNTLYQKATQTQFTLTAADLNFGRYDLIYANTSDQILKLDGTASSSPVIPTVPANSVMIDIAFSPASDTGQPPYLLYGNNNATADGKYTINKTEADLIATGGGDWYLEFIDNSGNDLPANVMPYSVISYLGPETYPIPALIYDDYSWDHPRIYGFPDPATAQTITILAI